MLLNETLNDLQIHFSLITIEQDAQSPKNSTVQTTIIAVVVAACVSV